MKLYLKIPPLALALMAAILIWVLNRYAPVLRIRFMYQNIVVCVLIGAGVSVALAGVLTFIISGTTVDPRSPEKASGLVIVGIYKYSRNPMYLGILLVLAGIVVYFGALSNTGVLIAFVAFINKYQIMPEEAALQKKFGDRFIKYTQSVRRWL